MLREQIKQDIAKAIKQLTVNSLLFTEKEIEVTRTSNPKFGDFATNLPLKIASSVIARNEVTKQSERKIAASSEYSTRNDGENYQSPMEIANILADSLKDLPYIEKLQAVNPGFVNFFVKDSVWQEQVKEVLNLQDKFGSNKAGVGKKVRIEFVSANPTGPLHFGNARGGPIGDVLASVLDFSGYKVLREYYSNDVGVQIEKLGQTIMNVASGQKIEDQEYKGEYIKELVKKISQSVILGREATPESNLGKDSGPDITKVKTGGQARMTMQIGRDAVKILSKENIADCEAMGIKFDKVYGESEFIESGKTEEAIKFLEKKGSLKKKEGATWFAPNDEFLKDRETVVIKTDGSYTYFANDIAYHRLKFDEKYDLVVDVLGANHHGHVPRLNAAISALGFDVSSFKVILYQWVRFRKDGKPLSMSKRAGSFITAREVLEEIGRDALRFMLLMYDANSPFEFDIDLAREKSAKNPVYYVQYAHARICSILKNAGPVIKDSTSEVNQVESLHTSEVRGAEEQKVNYSLLSTNYELNLIKQISKFPELVLDISKNFAVNQLTVYAMELADAFHKFYENCRVLPSEATAKDGDGVSNELSGARLALVEATKVTLGNTFRLLGISAPEKM